MTDDAAAIWRNGKIPVIYDRGRHQPLLVRAPCSCGGGNHGSHRALDHIISEYFAFSWGPRQLSCRLITARKLGENLKPAFSSS